MSDPPHHDILGMAYHGMCCVEDGGSKTIMCGVDWHVHIVYILYICLTMCDDMLYHDWLVIFIKRVLNTFVYVFVWSIPLWDSERYS